MKVGTLVLTIAMGLSALAGISIAVGVKDLYFGVPAHGTERQYRAMNDHSAQQQYAPFLRPDPSLDAWTTLMCSRESYEAPSFWSH